MLHRTPGVFYEIDHLGFAVSDLDGATKTLSTLGFEKAGKREFSDRGLRSILMVQNRVRIILNHSIQKNDPVARFISDHGEGIINVSFRCEDAISALEHASQLGFEVIFAPRAYAKDFGKVEQATVQAYGDILHTFLSREGNVFAEGFEVPIENSGSSLGLEVVQKYQVNTTESEASDVARFYTEVFGFESKTLQDKLSFSCDGAELATVSWNDPEFVDVHHGTGISVIRLGCLDPVKTIQTLKDRGVSFINQTVTDSLIGQVKFELAPVLKT